MRVTADGNVTRWTELRPLTLPIGSTLDGEENRLETQDERRATGERRRDKQVG